MTSIRILDSNVDAKNCYWQLHPEFLGILLEKAKTVVSFLYFTSVRCNMIGLVCAVGSF